MSKGLYPLGNLRHGLFKRNTITTATAGIRTMSHYKNSWGQTLPSPGSTLVDC